MGDINGDGFADLAVSIPEAQTSIYLGGPNQDFQWPDISVGADQIVGVGDVNGDGYADGLAPNGCGDVTVSLHLCLFYGGPSGFHRGIELGIVTEPHLAMAAAGDVNGDGYSDLLWSTYSFDSDNPMRYASGTAYVTYGSANLTEATQDVTLEGPEHRLFGALVLSAGDLDGDTFSDVIVDQFSTTSIAHEELNTSGAIWFYQGGSDGLDTDPWAMIPETDQRPNGQYYTVYVTASINGG